MNACFMMERCPGMRCQQASVDGSRGESGDERAMVTSPPRSPGSPQTVLRDNTPSPPSRLSNSNGPVWTRDAGLDNPAFEESTEEDSGWSQGSIVKVTAGLSKSQSLSPPIFRCGRFGMCGPQGEAAPK